jgi:glutamine synthetase
MVYISDTAQLVPTVNGYKRLVGGEAFWAPNAITYGYDSRATSIRIISPPCVPPAATRLEIRVPGADMNPYFALSAIFALGIRGIKKQAKLPCPPISHSLEAKKNNEVKSVEILSSARSYLWSFKGEITAHDTRVGNRADDEAG